MLGGDAPAARGLRPSDPRQLGDYRIVGRLGEGGMGSVYLAEAADGRQVALKVIRAGLADDAEFRRRFRSEVARARQVPPFCTAEVLDADTEHEPPYLVVEYVDGPSLASVVQDRGPLTPANQQGIAVGVAVALTAIHGAGVIHRDLKPSNVLLAPGSPKVIDFGIARAAQADGDAQTRTDQVVGTVSYMAPERFGPNPGQTLTPAADIFAWGAVVAYAATGRTPFEAETPAAMAVRIMTQPPDLEGMTGPLRDLVELALAKDPAQRPTARELVDHLLAGGPVASRPAAFAEQPEVLAAAGISATATQTLDGPVAGPPPGPAAPAPTRPLPASYARGAAGVPSQGGPPPGGSAYGGPQHGAQQYSAQQHGGPPPGGPRYADSASRAGAPPSVRANQHYPAPGPRPRRRGVAVLITVLSLAVVVLAGAVYAVASGRFTFGGSGTPNGQGPTTPAGAGATGGTGGSTPTSAALVQQVLDTFTGATAYTTRNDPANHALCEVNGNLRVVVDREQTYRCLGQQTTWTDFTARVAVTLVNPGSCAGIWFRYKNETGGYAVRVCEDGLHVVTHVGNTVRQLKFFPTAISLNREVAVTIAATGDRLAFQRDNLPMNVLVDGTLAGDGRVVLGVFQDARGATPPFEVLFSRLEVLTPA